MKIGIDASRAFREGKTGTEGYSYELLKRLASFAPSQDEVVLFVKKGARIDMELPRNFSLREVGGDFLWTQLWLSLELLRRPVDVLFVPSHTLPLVHPAKSVVTIHGLEYRTRPDCYSHLGRMMMEVNTRLSLIFARRVIVPSGHTRDDLRRYYRVPEDKISVIWHGAPAIRSRQEEGKNGDFNVLYVGRIEKRKNIKKIVEGFGIFLEKAGESGGRAKLTLAGADGYGAQEIKDSINASKFSDKIILAGYVDEREKDRLLREADVFLFPSLAEGFGLPVLEAMAYGMPVVTSRGIATEEVAGDAALLVDPERGKEIGTALVQLFESGEKRSRLREKGYENLSRFSWERCAGETWKLVSKW